MSPLTAAKDRISGRDTLQFDPGIGQATAQRTYLRKDSDDQWESREELSARVAGGNVLLHLEGQKLADGKKKVRQLIDWVTSGEREKAEAQPDALSREFLELYDATRTGGLIHAGRHLQHSDPSLADRNIEVATNCSTAASSAVKFLLLLNGSGVGRLYDDDVMMVDWAKQPDLFMVLSEDHPDFGKTIDGHPWQPQFLTPEEANEKAASLSEEGRRGKTHRVADSREGWGKAVELLENMTYQERSDNFLILDFSDVRGKGEPIAGMQNRPASGPVPLMCGLQEIADLKGRHDLEPWESTMMVDHELAAIVAVGGVRRAARIAIKNWRDPGVFRYVEFKRALENQTPFGLYYWSSNNSIGVDSDFWDAVRKVDSILEEEGLQLDDFAEETVRGWKTNESVYEDRPADYTDFDGIEKEPKDIRGASYRLLGDAVAKYYDLTEEEIHAANLYIAATACAYYDGTGEPGFVNVDKIDQNTEGLSELIDQLERDPDKVIGYGQFGLSQVSRDMYVELAQIARTKLYPFIVNPCSEIVLMFLGGYCVIGSLAPANLVQGYTEVGQKTDEELEAEMEAMARAQTRFLMRVNQLPALYQGEVDRTNRIGVGLCALHEVYLAHYGLSFEDVTDPVVFSHATGEGFTPDMSVYTPAQRRSIEFWEMVGRVSQAVLDEAKRYAKELGVPVPHTLTMGAPNGSTSKLFNLTEGSHLPSLKQYLRNVQFSADAPLVEIYEETGYPVSDELNSYPGKKIVGFPTKPLITTLADRLGLRDKITTAAEASPQSQYRWVQLLELYWISGSKPGGEKTHPGNQISYSLKFNPDETSYQEFHEAVLEGQPNVRATSMIVQDKVSPDPFGLLGQEPRKGGPYEYLPEQRVSAEVFDALKERINAKAKETLGGGLQEDISREHIECEGEACPVDFRDDDD